MINKIFKIDWILFLSCLLLLGVGLTVLYSISMATSNEGSLNIFWRQLIFATIGMIGMLFFALTNYQHLKSKSTPVYFLTLAALFFVLLFGKKINGTVGWIGIAGFHIQPVELAKLALIIFLASFISQKKMELGETGRIIASLILSGIMVLLVLRQPDFGSAMVLMGIWAGMTLVVGVSYQKIIIIAAAAMMIASVTWFHLQQYQKDRILNFARPGTLDVRGAGYNVNQAMIAVGSGGITGKGIGHGSQSQLNFLPEKHTDFIFASLAEELGLLGSLFVIGLFLVIFWRMKVIAKSAPDNFGYLFTVGVMLMFFIQVLINIGMNIGVMPVTGIPLPFLSYGGSSLITIMATMGIVSNISSMKETTIREDY